jgi:uncharacterized protein
MTRRGLLEIVAVVVTAALHFVFYDLLPGRGVFIVATTLAWSTYFVVRMRRSPQNRRDFGLSTQGLRQSSLTASIVLLIGVATCFAIGISRGTVRLAPQMLILALLYPVWGLVQQLLVQAMIVRNLRPVLATPLVVVIAAVLFGLVHLPEMELALATAALGGIFTLMFLRWRNVWALGVCHGLLGVFFYFWVLGRNPWLEIVGGA